MKNLNDSKLEGELLENLKSLEVNPPYGLWDDIETTLIAKNRKRIILITSWASAASIALMFTIGTIYFVGNDSVNNIQVSKTNGVINSQEIKKIEKPSYTKAIKSIEVPKEVETSESVQRNIASLTQNTSETQSNEVITDIESIPSTLIPIRARVEAKNKEYQNLFRIVRSTEVLSNSLAHVDESNQKVNKEWIVSASGFPVYSFHTSGVTNKSINNKELGIVSWGGSFTVRHAITRGLSLESGLVYNILGQQEKDIYLVFSSSSNYEVISYPGLTNSYGLLSVPNTQLKVMDINGVDMLTTNAVNNSNFNKVNALQQFRYLEIPVLLVKNYTVKGIIVNIKGGFSAGFLIGNMLELSNSNITLKGKTKGVDPFVASTIASLGLSIPILQNINFSIEPSFRLGLNSLSTPSGKSYPFSTFIKFGIEVPLH